MPDDDITEPLKTLYEKNYEYHHVKERVVWLAGTIYLTFSIVLISWYLLYQSKIPDWVEPWHSLSDL